MPGHHGKEQNAAMWRNFSPKIPKLWAAWKQLARTVPQDRIEIVVRERKAPAEPER